MIVRTAFSAILWALLLFHLGPKAWAQGFLQFIGTADSLTVDTPQEVGDPLPDYMPFKFLGVRLDKPDGPDFIVVSPSTGTSTTPLWIGMNPRIVPYLPPGKYGLVAEFAVPGQSVPGGGVQINLTLYPPPSPVISSIVSAASLQSGVSPGEIVSIFGANIGTPPISGNFDDAGLYPATLGNTTVTFNGTPAALLYVSTNQANAVVPFEVAGQKSVSVVLTHDFVSTAPFSVSVGDTSPAIFTTTQSGKGQGAILNATGPDSSVPNSADNPAPKGSGISIFGTGGGVG